MRSFRLSTVLLALGLIFLSQTIAAPAPEPAAQLQPRNKPSRVSSLKSSMDRAKKYYSEPGIGEIYGHYDSRYYSGEPLEDRVRIEALRHLIQAYLSIARHLELETWLAHGTLLGWWWNGKNLPWDGDLDVQVSLSTLATMAHSHNFTTHNYTYVADNGKTETRAFLLDINPNWEARGRGNWLNMIDGRFIDVTTGLFVDITGLAELNPEKSPGVWSCKNYHKYHTRDLYPLRETFFEGVPALVPYSYEQILITEYQTKALTTTKYEGHIWNQDRHAWIKEQT